MLQIFSIILHGYVSTPDQSQGGIMKDKTIVSLFMLMFALLMSSVAGAAPTAAEITGEIEHLTLNDPTNVYSGGVMIVGGTQVILPKNLLIDLPANRLSLQQIFAQAPAACIAKGESGLAKADTCNASGTGGFATLSGVHSNAGNIIAGDVLLEKGKEVVSGVVSYINYTDGYFRVNGTPGSSTTGVMVRLNDPTSKHTVQQGIGCTAGPNNCSPDPRFTLDPENYVITFSSGYPVCIPSTVARNFPGLPALTGLPAVAARSTQAAADGTGDLLCPSTNRTPNLVVEPDVRDSRLFAPLVVGDSVNAEGNYETISGTRFLSAHTMRVNKALSTKNVAGQPDYMFLEEVFLEAPGFQNQRARMLIIGFATLAPTDVDFWTIHRDPTTNSVHEFPLASIGGCDIANGVGLGGGQCSAQGLVGAGGNIFRIRYDVDFLLAAQNDPKFPGGATAKLNPCLQLQASPRFTASNPGICPGGATLANNFGIMSPIPHEIQARTGHKLDSQVPLVTLDINGGQATNGQYLFPFGINLGGVETADFLEIDINLLNTPRIFEGIPWNLDRRLSPSGCLGANGCEGSPQPLDPFPFTGLDPRIQADFLVAGLPGGTPKGTYNDPNFTASALSNASNRVFSFVNAGVGKFNGNNTLLPCASGLFPANCPPDPNLIPIVPTPAINIFPPVADEDEAKTPSGVPVTINVLANDIAVLGTIDPASVKIVTPPANGTAVVNLPAGTITYTPTTPFSVGTATFTYTVANNFGSVSQPATVTVTITVAPAAVNDTAIVPAGSAGTITLVTNDITGTSPLNLQSVVIVSQPTCGALLNNLDGDVRFTAPQTVPAGPGTCTFSYTISDVSVPALISNVATVTVTIAQPVAPVAVNDTATTTTGSAVIIPVLTNDTSSVNPINPASVAVTAPTGAVSPNTNSGSVSANLDGTVTYTAPATPGTYVFTYTVKNNSLTPAISNVASVTVTVTQGPIAPVATSDSATVPAGSSVIINVLGNDTATAPSTINPASLSVTAPTGGTAAANLDGTITYTAPATPGTHTFTYTVKSTSVPTLTSNIATVTVTVTVALPPAPTAIGPQGSGITTTPAFTFNAVAGATGYVVYVFNNNTASGVATSAITPAAAGCPAGTGTCSISLGTPLINGDAYTWIVSAQNASGQGPWSSYLNFVAGTPPAAPTSVSPTGTATTTPTYTFNAVTGATGYVVYVFDNNTASGVSTSVITPTAAGCPAGTGTCSIPQATPLIAGNLYTWIVSAENAAGQGPWSGYLNFTAQ